jgi:hypothetical protein
MTVQDNDFHCPMRQTAGHLHWRSRVHHRVGDEFAGEQHRIVDQFILASRLACHLPRPQRFADEAARCRGGRGLGLVRRGRNEIIPCLHVPS